MGTWEYRLSPDPKSTIFVLMLETPMYACIRFRWSTCISMLGPPNRAKTASPSRTKNIESEHVSKSVLIIDASGVAKRKDGLVVGVWPMLGFPVRGHETRHTLYAAAMGFFPSGCGSITHVSSAIFRVDYSADRWGLL